jgi:cytochrome c553/nitrate/TMAO reductase-like tetraheme cytochrome c subunit
MQKKWKIVLAISGAVVLVVIVLAGKLGIIPVPGVHSAFQTPGTCNLCHETWYDEASYAFNPKGNEKLPWGVTIGCAECHPVQYEEYKLSAMGSSKNPLRPGCVNCHDNVHSVFRWAEHMYLEDEGWKQVQIGLRDREMYNNQLAPRLAKIARENFVKEDSRRCKECHTRQDHLAAIKGTIGEFRPDIPAHQEMKKEGLTCVQCHQNLTHNLSVPAPWVGKQTPAQQGKAEVGKELSQACSGCHGVDGHSDMAEIPSIGGQNPNYIFLQLQAFKDGVRKNETMQAMVAGLSAEDMANLSVYFSQQQVKPALVQPKVLTLRQRADLEIGQSLYLGKCSRCHGLTGRGQGIFPPLAGQHPEYLVVQMKNFRSGARSQHSVMRDVSSGIDDSEMVLAARYLGALK